MRHIVLDTETTGLDPTTGHRIVEIGCVELHNLVPTNKTYHAYVNPQRDMPSSAFAVHGLSEEFLSAFPPFEEIVNEFLEFIGQDPLVIHNAAFDCRFLEAEITMCKAKGRGHDMVNPIIDTLSLAKSQFPGAPVSLDALCKRFQIDTQMREKHGALIDAHLLAEVYLHLNGGRQQNLFGKQSAEQTIAVASVQKPVRPPRIFAPHPDEWQAHQDMLNKMPHPLWRKNGGGAH